MKTITYEPNKYTKLGIKIWGEMFRELVGAKELIWRLFVRDLSAKYKQTVLGYFWAVLMPFVAIGSFVLMKKAGVMNIGVTDVPYPLFALVGLTVWQLFATGVVAGCNSLVAASSMITKINFPLTALIFASIAQALFEFLIKMVLIVVLFVVFRFLPPWQAILFPLTLIPVLFLTLGLSFLLSLVNGVFRDTANAVSIITTFLMFLTPVLYPTAGKYALFFKLNPLTALVAGPRDLTLYGVMKEPFDFWFMAAISVLFFFIAWRIFFLVKTKLPERL